MRKEEINPREWKRELERRVEGYILRMKRDLLIEDIPLDERGNYEILSGSQGDYGSRRILGTVRGRFVDVIAYASQLTEFLGDWCSWDLYDNCNHGRIRRTEIKEVAEVKKGESFDYLLKIKPQEGEREND